MKGQFGSYEIAKDFKELGFDELCLAFYDEDGLQIRSCIYNYGNINSIFMETDLINSPKISAPLWQQARDWIESKGLQIHDYYLSDKKMYAADLYKMEDTDYGLIWSLLLDPDGELKQTRREAWEQAIIKAIKILKTKP